MTRQPKNHPHLPHDFTTVLHGIADQGKPTQRSIAAKPFVKWVGGKRSILNQLTQRFPDFPEACDAYYEPFVGGGALFFHAQPKEAHLSDANFHLAITYQAIRDNVEEVIEAIGSHARHHTKSYYTKARKKLGRVQSAIEIAGLFIYINKTCFNGLYRVNKSGEFNVPIGSDKTVDAILDSDNLRRSSKALQGVSIAQRDFRQTPLMFHAFYYLDPPYHGTYSGYNNAGFDEDDHKALASLCGDINQGGGWFMLSNSDTPLIRSLYADYRIEEILASRSISCKSHQRGKHHELIIRNYY